MMRKPHEVPEVGHNYLGIRAADFTRKDKIEESRKMPSDAKYGSTLMRKPHEVPEVGHNYLGIRGIRAADFTRKNKIEESRKMPSDASSGLKAAKDRYDSSIWGTIMNTVNQWGVNVSKWLNARQFEQDNVLTKIGLGSWGRLGTAAAAAGALAAAYYAWKKWNKKREGENTPMVPANASFMPEFSDYIANEAERFDVAMCTAMTLLTEAVADGVADGQITARVNQMIASIKRDADKAARVLARIAQDQDASKAPPELMEQMAAVASMLEERNAA